MKTKNGRKKKKKKKSGEFKGEIGAVGYALAPSFRPPQTSPPKKQTIQLGYAFKDNAFQLEFGFIKC
jgi:hypothetical protein